MNTIQQDKSAITQVLENLYFKGLYAGNLALLQQLFHRDSLLFGDVKGVPYAKSLEQYLDGVASRVSPKDSGKAYQGEILSIEVINSIAVAHVRVQMYDFNYHDLLSFHKIDGNWVIVNKLLTHVEV